MRQTFYGRVIWGEASFEVYCTLDERRNGQTFGLGAYADGAVHPCTEIASSARFTMWRRKAFEATPSDSKNCNLGKSPSQLPERTQL